MSHLFEILCPTLIACITTFVWGRTVNLVRDGHAHWALRVSGLCLMGIIGIFYACLTAICAQMSSAHFTNGNSVSGVAMGILSIFLGVSIIAHFLRHYSIQDSTND